MSGIKAYGVAIPKRRIDAMAIWDVWKNVSKDILEKMGMKERTVTGPDEDPISLVGERSCHGSPRRPRRPLRRSMARLAL